MAFSVDLVASCNRDIFTARRPDSQWRLVYTWAAAATLPPLTEKLLAPTAETP
jgi:hypothetical protein